MKSNQKSKVLSLEKHQVDIQGILPYIKQEIENTKSNLAFKVNSSLVQMNWNIGNFIKEKVLGNTKAEYGEKVIDSLAKELVTEYGQGFSRSNLFNMVKFATIFSDSKIVQTLYGKLSWSHFTQLIYIEDKLKRDFYTTISHQEGWSVRTLKKKIQGMMYERTAISKESDDLIKKELEELKDTRKVSPNFVLKDPYLLNFLGLNINYS